MYLADQRGESSLPAQVAETYKIVGTPTVVFLDKKGVVRYVGNEPPKDCAARLGVLNDGS